MGQAMCHGVRGDGPHALPPGSRPRKKGYDGSCRHGEAVRLARRGAPDRGPLHHAGPISGSFPTGTAPAVHCGMKFVRALPLLAVAYLVIACSSSSEATSSVTDAGANVGTGAALAGAACTTASDCASGLVCGFRTVDGCAAQGVCVHKDVGACFGTSPDCACDGTLTSGCGTWGYTDKPFGHTGPCRAGAPCTVTGQDQECGPGLACGFHGCGPGVCVAAPAGNGICGLRPMCGCDGITTTMQGCPLDDGSTRGPFAHDGPCEDGGPDAATDAHDDH
jgi:hypothetical protein